MLLCRVRFGMHTVHRSWPVTRLRGFRWKRFRRQALETAIDSVAPDGRVCCDDSAGQEMLLLNILLVP
jgi:hypothetical protein